MVPNEETNAAERRESAQIPIVAGLLAGGLLGHLVAAYVNGGSQIAYLHHVAGFFIIAAVTALPVAGITWLFWRRHRNRALLAFGLIQLVLGVLVAVSEWRKL